MISLYLQQKNPLAMGVDAMETVVATKGFHFARPQSVDMSWFTYFSMDVVLILCSPFLILIALLFFCCCSSQSKTQIPKVKIQ